MKGKFGFVAFLLFAFLLASCGTTEPTYKKNDGLNKTSHGVVARSNNGAYCSSK